MVTTPATTTSSIIFEIGANCIVGTNILVSPAGKVNSFSYGSKPKLAILILNLSALTLLKVKIPPTDELVRKVSVSDINCTVAPDTIPYRESRTQPCSTLLD